LKEETVRAFKAGIDAMRGARDECETIADYLQRLVETYDASPQATEVALPQYMNIIKDELNHALRFMLNVFVPVTGITPDLDGIEEV
jgi:hypothetical protein